MKKPTRVSSSLALLILLVLLTAGVPGQIPTPVSPEAPPTQSLLAQADEIFEEMSRVTRLPIKRPLEKRLVSRREMEEHLRRTIDNELTPHEVHVHETTLRAFGIVSRDFDLKRFYLRFYTEQAAGAYDPWRKTMLIADWPGREMQRLVLAHELTHALQDQNFDLRDFLEARRANHDASNARQAVVEGHAMAAMLQYFAGPVELTRLPALDAMLAASVRTQMAQFPAFSGAPFFFRMEALFPYAHGATFIQRALAHGGWPKTLELFSNPPSSTKEIFEPAIYFDGRPPPLVPLPQPPALAPSASLHLLEENVMGQLGYYSLIGQLVSEGAANTTAGAWMADRYQLYEDETKVPSQHILVARTRWKDSESALAFFRHYRTILGGKYPELTPDKRSATDLFVGTAANGQVVLLRTGSECLWAEGLPAEKTDAMLNWLAALAQKGE